jgi:ParB-like nuclease domain
MSANMISVTSLVFDDSIYPRQNIDEMHIRGMMHAMEGGITLPPIIVERKSNRIVDGVHRYHSALRRGAKKISGVFKVYKNDAELFREAAQLNSGVGLKLGTDDSLKVIAVCERLGIKEIEQAALLRTSISHIRTLRPRFATISGGALKRIGLKASVRHLSGQTISAAQGKAMQLAPGNSYLLLTNQLISAIENDFLPSAETHVALWEKLQVLSDLLLKELKKLAAAA